MKDMYYYFYKITNNINGKYYYGVHSTDNMNDGYMGGGKIIRSAIRRYGIENFTKDILKFFENDKSMYEYEHKIVTEELVANPMCYNLCVGGKGGRKGTHLSEWHKQRLSEANKGKPSPMKGKHLSEEHRKKISQNSGARRPEVREKFRQRSIGRVFSEETRKKLSEKSKGRTVPKERRKRISNTLKGNIPWNKGKRNIYSEEIKRKIGNKSKDTKWINNGILCKMVKVDELETYLTNGFVLGRIINKPK